MITYIESINKMLAAIRETPISSVLQPLPYFAARAIDTISNVKRDVLRMGWAFNTDLDVTFPPDSGNGYKIVMGNDVLKVVFDKCQTSDIFPVLRGPTVYDRKNATFSFEGKTVKAAKVVHNLQWDFLPDTCRNYVGLRAARTFACQCLGDDAGGRNPTLEEMRAFREFSRECNDMDPVNMLDGPGTRSIAFRGGSWL